MRVALLTVLVACAVSGPPPRPAVGRVAMEAPAPTPAPLPAPTPVPVATETPVPLLGPRSHPLRNPSLFSPLPGGAVGGWYGDSGLDISARFQPVYALAAGTLEYSEPGHTLWTRGKDTANSVRIRLDVPIPWKNRQITHVYYTHLSALETLQHEGATERKHVVGGQRIATSGIGNGVPHLHLGLLLDNQVEQDTWDTLLREDAIRAVLGGYKNGEALP